MSSLIPTIGSYLPAPVQMVLRAAAPIVVDYLMTRSRNHLVAWIPALGTLALVTRNVTTLEKVADSLIYVTYKALHIYFLSRAENKTSADAEMVTVITDSLSSVSDFEKLQKQFKDFLPAITWSAGSSYDRITPSEIRERWGDRTIIGEAGVLFALAVKDSRELYDTLTMAAMDTNGEQRYKKMADLLMRNQLYYKRLCDPSKPSILFLYHFARGYGYYTRVGGAYYPHSLSLENCNIEPFYQVNATQFRWRSIYNEQVAQWANILKYLPVDSVICKCAVTDYSNIPLDPMHFPDNFLIG